MWIAGLYGYRRFKNCPWARKSLKNWFSFCLTGTVPLSYSSAPRFWGGGPDAESWVPGFPDWWCQRAHPEVHTLPWVYRKSHIQKCYPWRYSQHGEICWPQERKIQIMAYYTKYQNQNVLSELLWETQSTQILGRPQRHKGHNCILEDSMVWKEAAGGVGEVQVSRKGFRGKDSDDTASDLGRETGSRSEWAGKPGLWLLTWAWALLGHIKLFQGDISVGYFKQSTFKFSSPYIIDPKIHPWVRCLPHRFFFHTPYISLEWKPPDATQRDSQ